MTRQPSNQASNRYARLVLCIYVKLKDQKNEERVWGLRVCLIWKLMTSLVVVDTKGIAVLSS